jgi:hypothetical protein
LNLPVILGPDGRAIATEVKGNPTARGPLTSALASDRAQGKRGSRILRDFADTCEPARMAINRRKRQIARGAWKLVRISDPKAPVNPTVNAAVHALFKNPDPKGRSWRSFVEIVLEDTLVLDSGTFEKEFTVGGGIKYLHVVDGGSIRVRGDWTGLEPTQPRYEQWVDGRIVATILNDELTYIMASEASNRCIGMSPIEYAIQTIENFLFAEEYQGDQLRNIAPPGLLYLGDGWDPDQVQRFRTYYQSEIAGKKSLGIFGTPGMGAGGNGKPEFIGLTASNKDQELAAYRMFLAYVIAGMFEMDPVALNLAVETTRAGGRNMQKSTDEGHTNMATLFAEYVTREVIMYFDEDHAFVFDDLNDRDALQQGTIDKLRMSVGALTPNMLMKRDGLDPFTPPPGFDPTKSVFWADLPYPFNNDVGTPQTSPGMQGEPPPEPDGGSQEPGADPKTDVETGDKGMRPFAAPRMSMGTYLNALPPLV